MARHYELIDGARRLAIFPLELPVVPSHDPWFPTRGANGAVMLRSESGQDPLRHPNRRTRIRNWFKAAQAPALEACVHALMTLAGRVYREPGYVFAADYERLGYFCSLILSMADPDQRTLALFAPGDENQQDMEFELPHIA